MHVNTHTHTRKHTHSEGMMMQFADCANNEASIQRLWATSEIWTHLREEEKLSPREGTLSKLVENMPDDDVIVV